MVRCYTHVPLELVTDLFHIVSADVPSDVFYPISKFCRVTLQAHLPSPPHYFKTVWPSRNVSLVHAVMHVVLVHACTCRDACSLSACRDACIEVAHLKMAVPVW